MTNETERHMIQIQEACDTPKFNTAWVDEQFPSPDIDVVNPDCPCMPDHPPYYPPALGMDRLYHLQMDLANGLPLERGDQQALINEIIRLRGEATERIGGTY